MSNEYIYRIVPKRPEMLTEGLTEEEQRLAGEHFQYLTQLAEQGICILAGRTQTNDASTFGIAIYKAENEESAREIMNADPAIKGGVFIAELFPFKVAVQSKH